MSLQVIDPDDVIYDILNQQYSGVIVMNEIPGSYLHHNLWGGTWEPIFKSGSSRHRCVK